MTNAAVGLLVRRFQANTYHKCVSDATVLDWQSHCSDSRHIERVVKFDRSRACIRKACLDRVTQSGLVELKWLRTKSSRQLVA